MLTVPQLAVLLKYRLDQGWFAREALPAEKQLVAALDWQAIAELVQDLRLYHRGLVAPSYARQLYATLRRLCADDETSQILLGYASTL